MQENKKTKRNIDKICSDLSRLASVLEEETKFGIHFGVKTSTLRQKKLNYCHFFVRNRNFIENDAAFPAVLSQVQVQV